MKNLVFIENFSSKYHLPEGDIIALNVKSHYELLKREINHYTISDLFLFKSSAINEFLSFLNELIL